jgi:hypothetical protein
MCRKKERKITGDDRKREGKTERQKKYDEGKREENVDR